MGYSRGKGAFVRGGSYWDAGKDRPLLNSSAYLSLIDYLEKVGLIENIVAKQGRNRYSSRMRATSALIDRMKKEEVSWAAIYEDTTASSVIVKDKKGKVVEPPDDPNFDLEKAEKSLFRINENLKGSLLNLNVTNAEMETIRKQLTGGIEEEEAAAGYEYREPLEFQNRRIRRIFAHGRYAYGGRFYGGWWQGLPSKYRKHIEIEGCITCEMDYSTIQPRFLYAKVGTKPPEDSYEVPGWDKTLRDTIKKAFNQLVNSRPSSRSEKQWHRFAPDTVPERLPRGWESMTDSQRRKIRCNEFRRLTGRNYRELLHDLKKMHEPIDEFFFSQAWTWMQRMDSDVAEKVMLRLLDHQVTALPIHDSFIVRRDAEGLLEKTMNEAFEEVVGLKGKITKDKTVYDPPEDAAERAAERRIRAGKDIEKDAKKDITERSLYYKREVEWRKEWGPQGYE